MSGITTSKRAAMYRAAGARLFARLAQGESDACWEWPGARDDGGYGRLRVGGQSVLAHRVAFAFAFGELPEAVCHRCDNPPCCNPAHLFGGTRADNNRDMASKGRHGDTGRPGMQHHSAKLTDEAVLAIRARYAAGGASQRTLAREYGVTQRAVARITQGVGWKHV